MALPAWLIPAAISLGTSLFAGTRDAPDFGVSAADINRLIEKYRESGLAGIKQLGIQERENATARLASSGIEPTLGIQQSLYNPILQKLSIGRSELEGRLASAESNLLLGQAQGQQTSDLMGYQNQLGLFGGIGDLAGLFALSQFYNPGTSDGYGQTNFSAGSAANTFGGV